MSRTRSNPEVVAALGELTGAEGILARNDAALRSREALRLRGDVGTNRGKLQLYSVAIGLCAALVLSSDPRLAALLALLAVAVAGADWLRRR